VKIVIDILVLIGAVVVAVVSLPIT